MSSILYHSNLSILPIYLSHVVFGIEVEHIFFLSILKTIIPDRRKRNKTILHCFFLSIHMDEREEGRIKGKGWKVSHWGIYMYPYLTSAYITCNKANKSGNVLGIKRTSFDNLLSWKQRQWISRWSSVPQKDKECEWVTENSWNFIYRPFFFT